MNRAIILVRPGCVRDEGDCLALKVFQVAGVNFEFVDVKVVLRVRVIVFVNEMDRFQLAARKGICRVDHAAAARPHSLDAARRLAHILVAGPLMGCLDIVVSRKTKSRRAAVDRDHRV